MNAAIPSTERSRSSADRTEAVVRSALWAAAGDALGWITELSRGEAGVAHRTGSKTVSEPVDWQRMIGGRLGPRVHLPAGTYSDDTQLRLSVSRSIRGDGNFDVEAFAKVEVTIWPSYALGAGLGTKAAAAHLARRSVNWFSNFFDSAGQTYINGGGNGAAMRIQPHVWAGSGSDDTMIDVLRNAIVTHGHPHGFCGAVFHARCVSHALIHGAVPGPEDWARFVKEFDDIPRLISADSQLAAFWLSAWEGAGGRSLQQAIAELQNEAIKDVRVVSGKPSGAPDRDYLAALDRTGCLSQRFRGSGQKTALAAAVLCWLFRDRPLAEALVVAANALDSDTDTIATMAGAIGGCVSPLEPDWSVQDRDYITREARRLAAISAGTPQDSFTYPDLVHWTPPTKQTAVVGVTARGLAMIGLGEIEPIGPEYPAGDAVWQWCMLPFGQTVLAKRKASLKDEVKPSQLPGTRQAARPNRVVEAQESRTRNLFDQQPPLQRPSEQTRPSPVKELSGLDYWTDIVIQGEFEDRLIGRTFNRILEETQSADVVVAFAAIIAKAKLARERRRRG
ncbi:ADP-ribosylglycohydrolase family protein [Brevundimonas sp.]|uniref:ADP-ribosylglycohydrolase family protein n=1 Tax=Brevundimonas sp. TaxID=1871086 RepID=UPI001A218244|nr:ADP-ribosylglycohydrolase family protein [Brevundimonas sp.]MBJ7484192.1 ADP-ribosylglycohydrolase family protein [Brevundimonas sp.]